MGNSYNDVRRKSVEKSRPYKKGEHKQTRRNVKDKLRQYYK
jgi:hypothetical protein